jgi:7-carboxy-7-deazaguanine synthase (Cx14CxxC type)
MTGCNLWTGREQDRSSSICKFCDTNFVGTDGDGGGRFETAQGLASHIRDTWKKQAGLGGSPYVFFTGGEPLLQVDAELIRACHAHGFEVGVETNGTQPCPEGFDWVCVSPKAGAKLRIHQGDELKLVHPQRNLQPSDFESLKFERFSLQPLDDSNKLANLKACIDYCVAHPQWRLTVQTHKLIGVR